MQRSLRTFAAALLLCCAGVAGACEGSADASPAASIGTSPRAPSGTAAASAVPAPRGSNAQGANAISFDTTPGPGRLPKDFITHVPQPAGLARRVHGGDFAPAHEPTRHAKPSAETLGAEAAGGVLAWRSQGVDAGPHQGGGIAGTRFFAAATKTM